MNPTEAWFNSTNIIFFLLGALFGAIILSGIAYHLFTTSALAFTFFNITGLSVAIILTIYLNEGSIRLKDGSLQTPWRSIVFFFLLTVLFLGLPLARSMTIKYPAHTEIVRRQTRISLRIVGISFGIAWAWGAFIFLVLKG